MASQSGVASSGPFTFQVPVATAGVEKEYPVMCPTCPSVPAVTCTGPSKAHLPTSATRSGPAHVACQRDGTTALPRPRDHLGVDVMVIGSPLRVNQDTPDLAGWRVWPGRCRRR